MKRNAKIVLEATVLPADYETRTDNEALISPPFISVYVRYYVACLIKFQSIGQLCAMGKKPNQRSQWVNLFSDWRELKWTPEVFSVSRVDTIFGLLHLNPVTILDCTMLQETRDVSRFLTPNRIVDTHNF